MEGRLDEYDELVKELMAGGMNGRVAQNGASKRMGYEGYEEEVEWASGRRALAPSTVLLPPTQMERVRAAEEMSSNGLIALREAWSKIEEEGLQREAFKVNGAYALYLYYWDVETRKDFMVMIKTCIITPTVKAGVEEAAKPADEKTPKDRKEIQDMIREATA